MGQLAKMGDFKPTTKVEVHFNSPQVKNINDQILQSGLDILIASTFQKCGQTTTPEDLAFMRDEMILELRTSYAGLTTSELKEVFKCGFKKDYGEYHGLNVKTFCLWIKSYYESEKRQSAVKLALKPARVEITHNEKIQSRIDGLLECKSYFEEYKKVGRGHAWVYKVLDSLNQLSKDKLYKYNVHQQALKSVRSSHSKPIDKNEARNFKEIIDNLNEKGNGVVIAECHKIVLNEYFSKVSDGHFNQVIEYLKNQIK